MKEAAQQETTGSDPGSEEQKSLMSLGVLLFWVPKGLIFSLLKTFIRLRRNLILLLMSLSYLIE